MGYDVFISHSSKDKAVADAVCAALEANGVRCWIAPRDIVPGRTWASSILQGISQCRAMVLVFSSSANDSKHVCREVERAVFHNIPVAPVRIQDVAPTGDLEYFLSSPHWMDALTPPFTQHLRKLAAQVRLLLEIDGRPAGPAPDFRPAPAAEAVPPVVGRAESPAPDPLLPQNNERIDVPAPDPFPAPFIELPASPPSDLVSAPDPSHPQRDERSERPASDPTPPVAKPATRPMQVVVPAPLSASVALPRRRPLAVAAAGLALLLLATVAVLGWDAGWLRRPAGQSDVGGSAAAMATEPAPAPPTPSSPPARPPAAPAGIQTTPAVTAPRSPDRGRRHTDFTNTLGMGFVRIAPGEFDMGSPEKEGHETDEVLHRVKLTKGFFMGATPVTQGQWKELMGTTVRQQAEKGTIVHNLAGEGDDFPMYYVSWNDAVAFCRKLGDKEGKRYRLPTEAEWEYACRAGTKTAYYTGDGEAALAAAGWYEANSGGGTHPVGLKQPNAWGLYDMHGNVNQWCSKYERLDPAGDAVKLTDDDGSAGRCLRGGSYIDHPPRCRCANRSWERGDVRVPDFGFRLCLDID